MGRATIHPARPSFSAGIEMNSASGVRAMITNCCNSDCRAPFDFRQGRIVRICKALPADCSSEIEHPIEHFWLCGNCSELYVFEFESKLTLKPKRHPDAATREKTPHFASAA
jgi:hypothetical protein